VSGRPIKNRIPTEPVEQIEQDRGGKFLNWPSPFRLPHPGDRQLTGHLGTNANGVKESLPFLLSMIDELGGPRTYNHYPVGWAHAMDTPMQWTKQIASHFGGTRNGMAISSLATLTSINADQTWTI
jgi:arylsulfatase A-like enzyme